MKSKIIVLALAFILAMSSVSTITDVNANYVKKATWDELIHGDELDRLGEMTVKEQHNALTLQEKELEGLSLDQLIDLALDYPLLGDLFLFDSASDAVDYFLRSSGLFEYIHNQPNIDELLIDRYRTLVVDYSVFSKDESYEEICRSGYVTNIFLLTYFSSKYDELSSDNKELLIKAMNEKCNREYGDVESQLIDYCFFSELEDNQIVDISSGYSYSTGFSYLGPTVTRSGVQYHLGIYGKYGVSVSCLKHYSGEVTAEQIAAAESYVSTYHSTWQKLSNATAKYNCHSYAWIQESYSNVYWLDNPMTFANTFSPDNVTDNAGATYGDIIVIFNNYNDAKHSAISKTTSNNVINIYTVSKLGMAGVYRAPLADLVDEYGTSYSVYH